MLAYSLNHDIDSNKLLHDIQNLVSKTISPDKQFVLVVRVQEVTLDNTSLIPKIEYNSESNL
jgi:hypothetical protein